MGDEHLVFFRTLPTSSSHCQSYPNALFVPHDLGNGEDTLGQSSLVVRFVCGPCKYNGRKSVPHMDTTYAKAAAVALDAIPYISR